MKGKKQMSAQHVVISNSGPNGVRVSGGSLTTPQDVANGTSLTVEVVPGVPTVIQALTPSGNLAGGPGEE